MKIGDLFHAALIGALLCATTCGLAPLAPAQAFSSVMLPPGMEGDPSAPSAPDSSLYANGTRAINEGRWSDAAAIFSQVAALKGDHADGALYWKAYAENRQGLAIPALSTCNQLRHDFSRSRWIDECGALEIEIRAQSGKPVPPQAEQDENLKLLALNALMRQDESRALAQIQEILKSDFSERSKEGTIFILSQSKSAQARELLNEIAQKKINAPHSSPVLQMEATAALEGRLLVPLTPVIGDKSRAITLDVVVTDKSGQPVSGLKPEDFKLIDNKQLQSLISVQAANGMKAKADPPVEAILLIDAVNVPFQTVAMERQWLAAFFKENGGELALPTSLIILTDDGMNLQNRPTRDGKALQAFLDANATGLRRIRRSEGKEGAVEREQASLNALNLLAVQLANRPGRKLLLWLSHGWNVISNPMWIGGEKDRETIYELISTLSTGLRTSRITLYCISPNGGYGRDENYKTYLKGVDSPKHADLGDLLLPVVATQSGGQVPYEGNDLAIVINRCIRDAQNYYVLTFNPPKASHANEYHGIEVEIGKPGLNARTRSSYYAQTTVTGEPPMPKFSLQTVEESK